ncbi:hypothetical protein NVP1121O_128 [Vibrio phage 1.121.O._10N.286.46.C4]|nr:hypothetical protein NVP1121O_128 [Vibrio phage 1.121.O._10N.286.46.C4]
MRTSNTIVKMASKSQSMASKKDYTEFAVDGRKGRPDSRTRRNVRNTKRNFEL